MSIHNVHKLFTIQLITYHDRPYVPALFDGHFYSESVDDFSYV
jgi:hypothetical protein